jgi:hypothetical protein
MAKKYLPEPMTRCTFCTLGYQDRDTKIVGSRFGHEITHSTCRGCGRAMLFALERRHGHVACVGLLTDCDYADAVRFEAKERITLDEVLKVHLALHEF